MESPVFAVLQTMWKERNSSCFEGVSSSKEAMVYKVKFLIASWVSVLPIFKGRPIDCHMRCSREVAFQLLTVPRFCLVGCRLRRVLSSLILMGVC